ncbi:MAG: NADH:flavin oxidoreductase/NADH oxidase family protein [Deltaproteobacteria bacterium]|nr:NADH:flavin oxidoreductase/NADH oxidase family protein [Deltaproteobacteria bacterium]
MLETSLRLPHSGVVLANRIAKAAMSEVLGDALGAPSERLIRLYERWGKSGAGLLISGHVLVDRRARAEVGNVVIEDDRDLPMLRRWATAAQAGGAQMWLQLNHAGRQSPRRLSREPVAPSAVAMKGFAGAFAKPRALTELEIEDIIQRFARAAAVAQRAGFAGVEIHAAHGYLISQFLSARTNLRDDAWGGDPVRRARFLLEVVRAVRAAVGPAFPIGVKLNSADFQRGGFTIEQAMDVARALDGAGIDLLEVSGGNYESPAMAGSGDTMRASSREREAYFLTYAKQIRTVTSVPILLTGGMRTRATMEDALASGAVDVIGLARPMTYAPELPRQLLDGTVDAAPAVSIRSRIRAIDDALQVMWFLAQIHLLGDGREPDLRLGKWKALWRGLRASVFASKRAATQISAGAAPADIVEVEMKMTSGVK